MNKTEGAGQIHDVQMPFTSHLAELRSRLVKSLIAVALAFVICFQFSERLFFLLVEPLRRVHVPGLILIGTTVAQAFFTKLKVSFVAAVILSLPILLWQAWQFVAPGLYQHEKRYTRSFVLFGSMFFLAGAVFCYEVILQYGLRFMLQRYDALKVEPYIDMGEYLSAISRLVLAFGIIFEVPVVVYFLARIGLVDHRFLVRQFRYAILLIALLAAILTPPDVISQVLLALPLVLIYCISIAVAYFVRPRE